MNTVYVCLVGWLFLFVCLFVFQSVKSPNNQEVLKPVSWPCLVAYYFTKFVIQIARTALSPMCVACGALTD